ncbi:MAG: hypothetical protein ACNA7U_03595 [Candidatus Izemoplasmataceae bacterium]
MFRFIEKHPFVSGFITGFIGIGMIGKNIKKLVNGRVVIVLLETNEKETKNFGEKPSGEKEPKTKKEN